MKRDLKVAGIVIVIVGLVAFLGSLVDESDTNVKSRNEVQSNTHKSNILREKSQDYKYPLESDRDCYIPPCYSYNQEVLSTVELKGDFWGSPQCGNRACTEEDLKIIK